MDLRGSWLARASGWFWVLLVVIVTLAIFFPIIGRRRQIHRGEVANENLEILFQAKEALAEELKLDPTKPYPEIVTQLTVEDLRPHLPQDPLELDFLTGGDYRLGPLVDENAEVIPPIHEHEKYDPDGNGIPNGGEGYFIHRRSYLQDPNSGLWFRDPAFVFPR
jgi:hypothetical protein